MTISSRIEGVPGCGEVTLALPHLLGGQGAMATLPLQLAATEQAALVRSAGILRGAIKSLQANSKTKESNS
jgi:L-lactate dehydrogenase